MAKKKKQSMVITVTGERSIQEVADDLKAAGFEVDQVLDSIGVVTGSGDPHSKQRLSRIRGVADVSEDQPVDIGPPDAPTS